MAIAQQIAGLWLTGQPIQFCTLSSSTLLCLVCYCTSNMLRPVPVNVDLTTVRELCSTSENSKEWEMGGRGLYLTFLVPAWMRDRILIDSVSLLLCGFTPRKRTSTNRQFRTNTRGNIMTYTILKRFRHALLISLHKIIERTSFTESPPKNISAFSTSKSLSHIDHNAS